MSAMRIFIFISIAFAISMLGCQYQSSPSSTSEAAPEVSSESKADPADSASAKEEYERLQLAFRNDFEAMKNLIVQADTEDQKQQIFADQDPLPNYIDQLIALSEDYQQTPTAFDATLEAVSRSSGDQKDRNMRYMIQTCPTKLRYDKIVQSLYEEAPSEQIESWLKLMIQHAPEGKDRALAIMGFTTYIKNLPEYQRAFQKNPQLLAKLPIEQREYLASKRTEEQNAEVVSYLKEAIQKYPEIKYRMGRNIEQTARLDLKEFESLRVGKPAPEIIGEDLDGIEFKLSDYSGKIVMLDFWGHWCGPCRQMYPEEREMVQRLAGTPFVLIGMNSDHSLEFARDAVRSEGLSWRHFWNGPKGTRGPIAEAWNIDAWPTVYLIDGDGIIRYKDVLGEDLTDALETLLAEAGHKVDLSDLN